MNILINTDEHSLDELAQLVDALQNIGEYAQAWEIEDVILNERAKKGYYDQERET